MTVLTKVVLIDILNFKVINKIFKKKIEIFLITGPYEGNNFKAILPLPYSYEAFLNKLYLNDPYDSPHKVSH